MREFVGSGMPATRDGLGDKAAFNHPQGITVHQKTGDIYVTEYEGQVIRKISQRGLFIFYLLRSSF